MPRLSAKLLSLSALVLTGILCGCPPANTPDGPVAAFTANPVEGQAPLAVQFTDTSVAGAAPIVAWAWDFGDGETSTRPNPRKTFYHDPNDGNEISRYTVRLTVTSSYGVSTKEMPNLVQVSPGTSFEVIDPDATPYDGTVSVSGVVITVPQGALENKVVFGVKQLESNAAINFFEPMEIVSASFVITHDNCTDKLCSSDGEAILPATLEIPLLPQASQQEIFDSAKYQILALLPNGLTIPVVCAIVDGKVRAVVTGLPSSATYVVVYRPEMVAAEVELTPPDKSMTGFAWKNNWHISASAQLLQQLTALRLGSVEQPLPYRRRNFSVTETDATLMALSQAVGQLHQEYVAGGFRSPMLMDDGAAYSLVFYDMSAAYTAQYSSFKDLVYSARTFGSLVIDPMQLLSVSIHNAETLAADAEQTDIAQKFSAVNVFAQDLFLASFEAYGYPNLTIPSPAELDADLMPKSVHFLDGLKKGAAVYLGQWADGFTGGPSAAAIWARGFDTNEYYSLSNALFQPVDTAKAGYAVANQEFFFYLQNAFADQIVTSLVPLLASHAAPVSGILEELQTAFAAQPHGGADLSIEKALAIAYEAVNRSVTAFSGGAQGLPGVYEQFARDRAVENGNNGLLRQADTLLADFTLKNDRLAKKALHTQPLPAATDAAELTPASVYALKDIPPLSTRAVVVQVNPLASELMLKFNVEDWELDNDGAGLSVAAYKLGDNHPVTLETGQDTDEDGLPETLTFKNFFQDLDECYAKVVVLVSNLSMNTANSFSMTAESFAGMPVDESAVLNKFIYTCDPNYSFELVSSGTIPTIGSNTYVLHMTSGAWRGSADVNQTLWEHYITIAEPPIIASDTAMLMVSGGSTGSVPDPNELATLLLPFAISTGSVVALIQAVPNEPLQFAGETRTRSEDAILAYSYDQYMTGYAEGKPDMTWPALLPMTRAAVRAMDSIQEFMGKEKPGTSVPIKDFVVAGASKRGWTTWLTAAADSRVRAIVPIVIDVLNMDVQMQHHYNAYGFYAPAIQDYVQENVFDRFNKPEGASLLKIVDPYRYLNKLTMPKFIANSTGDQFFLPDSSQFYFNQLVPNTTLPNGVKYPNDTYLYYAPNTDHGLSSPGGLGVDKGTLSSILAFYNSVLRELDRPQFTWWVEQDTSMPAATRAFRIRVDTLTAPKAVYLWQATNTEGRDFRLETIGSDWVSSALKPFCDACGGDPGFVPQPQMKSAAAKCAAARKNAAQQTEGEAIGGSGYRTSVGSGADTVPVVVVSGTPYQMGYHYGDLMKAEIAAFIPSILDAAQTSNAVKFSNKNLDAAWSAVSPHIDARLIEEMQGLADGSGVTLSTLRRAHMIPVLSDYSCSSVAVWNTATADGHLYQTRNLDWNLGFGAQNYPCIVVYNPTAGIPHANVGFAGVIGAHTGINAEGVVLAEMGDSPASEYPYNYNGNHFMPMFREILYDAHNLTEALNILESTPRIKRYHYVFGDGKHEKRAVKIRAHAPEMPPNDLVIWSDNDPSDEYAPKVLPDVVYNDEGRGAFPHLYADRGTYHPESLIALANSIPIQGSNVMNVVYDATALTLWVSYAEGAQEAYQRTYVPFDLNEYLETPVEGEGQIEGAGEGEGQAEGAEEGQIEGAEEGEGQAEGQEDCECAYENGEMQSYVGTVTVPAAEEAYTAFFVQMVYPGPDPDNELMEDVDYVFSTRVVVVPNTYPDHQTTE